MAATSRFFSAEDYLRSLTLLFGSLAVIYFIPAMSHMFSVPLYYAEPMRIMVILAIAHTGKRNAFVLALTLPVFSFLVSAHPSLLKSILIALELVANVWLFYLISNKIKNQFSSMLISILLSKMFYYLAKFLFISFAFMQTDLIATPVWIQIISTLVFSIYVFVVFTRKQAKSPVQDPTADDSE